MYATSWREDKLEHQFANRSAWVLGSPGELSLQTKSVPVPQRAEVLVRIDALAICATDIEVIFQRPAGVN